MLFDGRFLSASVLESTSPAAKDPIDTPPFPIKRPSVFLHELSSFINALVSLDAMGMV
jgi:hypothetical protein